MRFPTPQEREKYPSQCILCGGDIEERSVTLSLPSPDGETRLVRRVPVGVCTQCGEQYLNAEVAETLEGVLSAPPVDTETVPVWEYAPGA